MSACTATDKPKIEILLATYDPRMDWLAELLDSLNAQAWPNLFLRVIDDCSPHRSAGEIEALIRERITAFPYAFERAEKNRGSNAVFEELTGRAESDYVAYCDQDDIWLPEKLETLVSSVEKEGALMACSDMYVIDGDGNELADSITKLRRHFVFPDGYAKAADLLFHNFSSGCTMLVNTEAAKASLPFCPYMVCDQHVTLYCADHGKVIAVRAPLIRYRVHGGNQTGVLNAVHDKQSYFKDRIESLGKRFRWLDESFDFSDDTRSVLRDALIWIDGRERNWQHKGGASALWKYRRFSPITSSFELFAPYMPEKLFSFFVMLAKKNIV